MMTQGYIDNGQDVTLNVRSDLVQAKHQAKIALAAEEGREFQCLCCRERHLRIIPYWDQEDRGWCLRRFRESDPHDPDCFTRDLGCIFEDRDENVLHTRHSVFGGKSARPHTDRVAPDGDGASKRSHHAQYGGFQHLFHQLFTRATLRAVREANPGRSIRDPGLANPAAEQVFWELAELLSEVKLTDGSAPTQAAAELKLRICWGITRKQIIPALEQCRFAEGHVLFAEKDYWTPSGPRQTGIRFRIPALVGREAGGQLKAHDHDIPPPYFFAALVDEQDVAVDFFAVPAAEEQGSLWLIQSGAEREFVVRLRRLGAVIIKLHVHVDMRELGERLWPFVVGRRGRLPVRSDAIIFHGGTLRLRELAGSDDPVYLGIVQRRVDRLKVAFAAYPEVAVDQRDVQQLRTETDEEFLPSLRPGSAPGAQDTQR